jgi:hypothetical protein
LKLNAQISTCLSALDVLLESMGEKEKKVSSNSTPPGNCSRIRPTPLRYQKNPSQAPNQLSMMPVELKWKMEEREKGKSPTNQP